MRAAFIGLSLAIAAQVAEAQSLLQRVLARGDGSVRIQYASRPSVCGGKRFIRMGNRLYAGDQRNLMMVTGRINSDEPCSHGPAETRLDVSGGRVVRVRSVVSSPLGPVDRDLGTVPAAEAARLFVDLLGRSETSEDERVFLAMIIADSATVWPDLIRIGSNSSLDEKRRSRALTWAGWDGDIEVRDTLAGFVRNASLSTRVRQGAAAGLAELDDPKATRILTDFVRSPGDATLRSHIVHIVNHRGDALPAWRTLAADASVDDKVRGAIFLVLSNSDDPKDGVVLRSLFPSLTTKKLRDNLMLAVSQRDDAESTRWLLDIGLSPAHEYETRKQALFWAGQSDGPVRDVVAAYDKLDSQRLREHMIFVLSQRDESEATDKLIAIARSDPDKETRKKAMFWLGQSDDPRAHAFLKEILQ